MIMPHSYDTVALRALHQARINLWQAFLPRRRRDVSDVQAQSLDFSPTRALLPVHRRKLDNLARQFSALACVRARMRIENVA